MQRGFARLNPLLGLAALKGEQFGCFSCLCAKILEKAIVPKTFIYITYLSYTISAPKIPSFLQPQTLMIRCAMMCCILPRFQIQNRKHEVILRKPGSLHGQQVTLEKLDGFHNVDSFPLWVTFLGFP